MPVIIGEWRSGSGDNTGGDTAQIVAQIKSVQAQGVGATAWWWATDQPGSEWSLASGSGSTYTRTGWGNQVVSTF